MANKGNIIIAKEVGKRFEQWRIAKGLNKKQISRETGISRSTIQKMAEGERLPGLNTLVVLDAHYGLSVDWLLKGTAEYKYDEQVSVTLPIAAEKVSEYDNKDKNIIFRDYVESQGRGYIVEIVEAHKSLAKAETYVKNQLPIDSVLRTKIYSIIDDIKRRN